MSNKIKYFSAATQAGMFYFCGDNKELAYDHALMLNENDDGFPNINLASIKFEGWLDADTPLPESDFNVGYPNWTGNN
jgi:hypothetical protein